MKDMIPRVVRSTGIFAGAFFLIGAVIEPQTLPWTLVTVFTGLLLLTPWTRLHNSMIWWPAYIALSALLLFLILGQAKAVMTDHAKPIINLIWILIELAQPIVIWKMKREPEPAGGAYVGCLTQSSAYAIFICMRTTLNIDDGLLKHASRLTGVREKTALVRIGLEALVARRSAQRLAALGGTEPQARRVPRRRPLT